LYTPFEGYLGLYWLNHFIPVLIGFVIMLYGMGYMAYQMGYIDRFLFSKERPIRERRDYLRVLEILLSQIRQVAGYDHIPEQTMKRIEGATEKVLLAFYDKHNSVEVYLPALVCGVKQVDFRYRIRFKDVIPSAS